MSVLTQADVRIGERVSLVVMEEGDPATGVVEGFDMFGVLIRTEGNKRPLWYGLSEINKIENETGKGRAA